MKDWTRISMLKHLVCGLPVRPSQKRLVRDGMVVGRNWELAQLVPDVSQLPIMFYCTCLLVPGVVREKEE